MTAQPVAVGVDLGGTKLRGLLVDGRGSVLAAREIATPREGPDAVIAALAGLVRSLAGREARAVGFGVPGPVDALGVVHAMPNVHPGFERFPLRERVAAQLGALPCAVENDANAALRGEAWRGAAHGSGDVLLLTLGTGIGGAILSGGAFVRGWRGVGGELGHVVVEPEGVPCGCGGRGCMEQYASGTALAREGGADARAVVAAARSGDARARSAIARAGRALGIGLASTIHALNPEVVVIGGGLGTAAFDLLAPLVLEELARRTFAASRAGLRIVPAALGVDAGAIGAAKLAFGLLGSLLDPETPGR